MVMLSRRGQRDIYWEWIQKRQTAIFVEHIAKVENRVSVRKNITVLLFFNNNRWPPGSRNRWPSGPPTSETRWPFGKSGGQWPPGHREFRALP